MRLVAERVGVDYPGLERPVLAAADLIIERGETVAVLGPSGSGKSTLLSVIGGIVRPTRGRAYIDNALAPTGGARLSENCAWILQTMNALPERSALANVALAGLARGERHAAAQRTAAALLDEVGLADRLHDSARVLSGGELQRVVVARALASGRPFLLADEPTGQLDAATSEVVLNAMFAARASAGSVGLVIVTHDPRVAERCGRTVRIDRGVVVGA